MFETGRRSAIAIFTKGTLCELAEISEKTGFGSVKELMEDSLYEDIFSAIDGLSVECRTESREAFSPSVKEFLKKHKLTGAVASSGRVSWGREKYLRFVEEYEKLCRTEAGIKATYRVIYACGKKL